MMDFEQAKKVLQVTDARIRTFGSVDASMSREIHEAIFKFQPLQRLVIAYHAQETLTHLREQTVPLANSLEQLIATAIKLNHAEFQNLPIPNGQTSWKNPKGVDPAVLARTFRRMVGVSPIDYRRQSP